ncbi:aminoglycoside phosphotransferase family protein [Bdellovibrio sp. HCB337]|uniref:aminoglycoside phosphotransferase family protein n=1 Tax=Bdellovibrio sp. HCB337 TaxID=3394358 RepID=UPI0039A61E87
MQNIGSKLEKYLTLWNLSDPKLVATTPTSFIYEVSRDEDLILKIFTETGAIDEKASSSVLAAWNGNGSVELKASDDGALLIERLEGPNLYFYSESKNETKATEIFVHIIKKIHSSPLPKNHSIPELSTLFKTLYDFTGSPEKHRPLFQKSVEVARSLISTQNKVVLLHGDLHHENVMKRKHGEYVCFDPKGFIGDPCYEIATILKNPWDFPEISENEKLCIERANMFADSLKLPVQRILEFSFVHMCLSAMWAIQDGQDYSHQMKIAQFLESYIS